MNQHQEKIRGQRGKLPVQPLGYVNCTKVIYRGALKVCFPRRPHQGQSRSDVLSESKIMADSVEIQFVDESEYQNEGKWHFYIENSQLELCADVSGNIFPFPEFTNLRIYGIFNIRFQGPKVWNSLGKDIKSTPFGDFKKTI